MADPIDGLFELLQEDSSTLTKHYALEKIVRHTDSYWFKMKERKDALIHFLTMEECREETRNIAALALSKMHFNFGEFDKSVEYVLQALPAFSPDSKDHFTVTMISKVIDTYLYTHPSDRAKKIPKIGAFFQQLFESWVITCSSNSMKELMGLVFATKQINLLKHLLDICSGLQMGTDFLLTCFRFACRYVPDKQFRNLVIATVVDFYLKGERNNNIFSLVKGLIWLDDTDGTSKILRSLIRSESSSDRLYAIQVSIDIFETSSWCFSEKLLNKIDFDSEYTQNSDGIILQHVKRALTGDLSSSLYAKFLYSKSSYGINALQKTKAAIDGKNLVLHNALIISNSFIFCGTTIDDFLRGNIAWVSKASHWAKFTAVGSLGGIYKGSISSCQKILDSYMPRDNKKCPYQGGGALLALGLASAPLHAHAFMTLSGVRISVREHLLHTIADHEGRSEVICGGALGIGLLMSGSEDEDIYNMLYSNLLLSEATSGEACAVGLGLLMLGSGKQETVISLLNVARETEQKEKIVRGISIACSLIMCGQESDCLPYAQDFFEDKDPWIRMGGCMMMAMAYAGTFNVSALESLLKVGIQDVSDDVKRTSIMCIGFLTFNDPSEALDLLREISESHNIHIRYGVAMCLGIAGSGTGHHGIAQLLWKMMKDTNEFVRQGSTIALSMVLISKSSTEVSLGAEFRDLLSKKIEDRHVDLCTKLGCILAQGILDAGGRNCTILLQKNGLNLYNAMAALLIFTQYWYWFPYSLLISQSFAVCCFIGLNQNLETPKCSLLSTGPKSPREAVPHETLPKPLSRKSSGLVELSTTRRERELEKAQDIRRGTSSSDTTNDDEDTGETVAEKHFESVPEHRLMNPCRISPSQRDSVVMDPSEKYKSLKNPPYGICMIYHPEHTAFDDNVVENFETPHDTEDFSPPDDFVLS